MKSPFVFRPLLAALAAVAGIGFSSVQAQDAKAEKLVDLKEPTIQAQSTPDIKAAYVKEKRWKPKDWLEFEIPFIASAPRGAPAGFNTFDLLTFKYYLFLDNSDKKKQRILTAEINHVNVPIGEGMASVVYLSPSAVHRLTGNSRVVTSAVTLWAVEVTREGKTVGFLSKDNKKWWESPNAPPTEPGVLKNKMETPFAPLWGDFHAEVQSSK